MLIKLVAACPLSFGFINSFHCNPSPSGFAISFRICVAKDDLLQDLLDRDHFVAQLKVHRHTIL